MAPKAAQQAKAPASYRDQLLKAIHRVDRPGSICTSRDRPLTMPGLEVDGVGTIRLPLGASQARKLIGQCSQAPYGKGTETLVDTNVRRVWELEPKQFDLANPQWNELVSSIVDEVRVALGLEQAKLTAHLYKLLVYEKGSFFLPHRDGEKVDGMVATLVICLPSPHTGGELVVSHEGQRQEIAFTGAASGHELSYAAFYADCEHEVRPVRDGFRLCLVYNLVLARSRAKKGITAPRTGEAVAAASALLRAWPSQEGIAKAAITLDHHYSQEGLTIDTLKGVDRARAGVLFDAADQSDCVAHLALITHWQSGSADGGYDYDYGRRRYWSGDDEPDESGGSSDHEMGEVFDQSLSASHWSDRDGKKFALGEMPLDESEIVSSEPLGDWDIGREEFEGYTGNAGMTLERWYHRAAIVVWPRKHHFQVLCGAGTEAAIAGLESMVKKWRRARKSDEQQQRASCMQFATAIIETWGHRRFHSSAYEEQEQERIDRSLFPLLLQELDAPELVRRLLAQVMPKDDEIQLDKSFPAFCRKHGWPTFTESLTSIIDGSSGATIMRNAALLEVVCVGRDKDIDRIEFARHLAEHTVAALLRLEASSSKRDWQMERIDRAALLTMLVKSLASVDAAQPLARLIDHALSRSVKYELTDVHLKAIFALESWLTRASAKPDRTVSRWLAHCRTELDQRTAQAPTPPADFRRNDKLSCTCGDCRELSKFLGDPHESVHHFPRAKDRRQHLHQIIDAAGCDLTHVTSRTGRPFTLVCTKTTASHKKSCDIYARDQENLQRLRAIEAQIS